MPPAPSPVWRSQTGRLAPNTGESAVSTAPAWRSNSLGRAGMGRACAEPDGGLSGAGTPRCTRQWRTGAVAWHCLWYLDPHEAPGFVQGPKAHAAAVRRGCTSTARIQHGPCAAVAGVRATARLTPPTPATLNPFLPFPVTPFPPTLAPPGVRETNSLTHANTLVSSRGWVLCFLCGDFTQPFPLSLSPAPASPLLYPFYPAIRPSVQPSAH